MLFMLSAAPLNFDGVSSVLWAHTRYIEYAPIKWGYTNGWIVSFCDRWAGAWWKRNQRHNVVEIAQVIMKDIDVFVMVMICIVVCWLNSSTMKLCWVIILYLVVLEYSVATNLFRLRLALIFLTIIYILRRAMDKDFSLRQKEWEVINFSLVLCPKIWYQQSAAQRYL